MKGLQADGPTFIEFRVIDCALLRDGVTTMEIKSGYGLDTDTELKMLRVARRIGAELGIGVRTTFLGAHAHCCATA